MFYRRLSVDDRYRPTVTGVIHAVWVVQQLFSPVLMPLPPPTSPADAGRKILFEGDKQRRTIAIGRTEEKPPEQKRTVENARLVIVIYLLFMDC